MRLLFSLAAAKSSKSAVLLWCVDPGCQLCSLLTRLQGNCRHSSRPIRQARRPQSHRQGENLVHHSLPTQVAIRQRRARPHRLPSHQQPVRAALRLLHLPCRYLGRALPRSCQEAAGGSGRGCQVQPRCCEGVYPGAKGDARSGSTRDDSYPRCCRSRVRVAFGVI